MWVFEWRPLKERTGRGITVWAACPSSTRYFGRKGQQLMINDRVDDLDALLRKLRQEGVWVHPKVEMSQFGKFAWIRDVDGKRVELWEPPRPKGRPRRRPRARGRKGVGST